MNKVHLFLDFDETIFNHTAFVDWMDNFFVQRFKIGASSFRDSLGQHHEYLPEGLRLYKHSEHVEKVTGRSWSYISGEMEREFRKRNVDFCYPEAHAAIKKLQGHHDDLRLLTYGFGEYQRFKISSCQLLRNSKIVIHVVSEPKTAFLQREFPNESGILVDDKYPLNLPGQWRHIWINRDKSLAKPVVKEEGVVQISKLSQLESAIKLLQMQED